MNAKTFQIIAKAQAEAERKAKGEVEEDEALLEAKRKARAARAARAEREAGDTGDWTQVYRQWDDFEDPAEIAAEEAEAKRKKERANAGRGMSACDHDHSAERRVFEMSWDERMDTCAAFRDEGNMFFHEGQFHRASIRYHHAITYFEYFIPDNDDQEKELDCLRLPVYSNYAACMLKLDRLDDALNYCQQALRIAPNSVKALYRKAQVQRSKHMFEKAVGTIEAALELAPTSKSLRAERARIRGMLASYKRNSRKVGAAMFAGSAGEKKRTQPHLSVSSPLLRNDSGGKGIRSQLELLQVADVDVAGETFWKSVPWSHLGIPSDSTMPADTPLPTPCAQWPPS